jgi:hypothetical protein
MANYREDISLADNTAPRRYAWTSCAPLASQPYLALFCRQELRLAIGLMLTDYLVSD